MKATNNGLLNPINECRIIVPGGGPIIMRILPELSDTKNAIYNNEPIIGRSTPLYTYSHSGDRVIGFQIHLMVLEEKDIEGNLAILRLIQSAVYPREDSGGTFPYLPPPICRIKCGDLLANQQDLCVVLQSYNVRFPTEVVWYEGADGSTYCPAKFDIDTSWLVVYDSTDLPFQTRIITSGR